MASSDNATAPRSLTGRNLPDIVLCRLIVPLWIATGAVLKFMEADPRLLPTEIWSTAYDRGVNLFTLLAVIISLEVLAISVMLFLPRLARAMAVFMLVCFCGILVNEMMAGSKTCGCLGPISPPPWLMLSIDGVLLLGVLLLPMGKSSGALISKRGLIAALVLTVLGSGAAGYRMYDKFTGAPPVEEDEDGPKRPRIIRVSEEDIATWVGQSLHNIELARYVKDLPDDMDLGRHVVIFYSRSCDHCYDLMEFWFYESLDYVGAKVTAVAVPERIDGFDEENDLGAKCVDCRMLELPVGTEWMLTPPIVAIIEDGSIVCAKTVKHPDEPECVMDWLDKWGQ